MGIQTPPGTQDFRTYHIRRRTAKLQRETEALLDARLSAHWPRAQGHPRWPIGIIQRLILSHSQCDVCPPCSIGTEIDMGTRSLAGPIWSKFGNLPPPVGVCLSYGWANKKMGVKQHERSQNQL